MWLSCFRFKHAVAHADVEPIPRRDLCHRPHDSVRLLVAHDRVSSLQCPQRTDACQPPGQSSEPFAAQGQAVVHRCLCAGQQVVHPLAGLGQLCLWRKVLQRPRLLRQERCAR